MFSLFFDLCAPFYYIPLLIFYRNAFKETLCGKKQDTTTFGTLAGNGGGVRERGYSTASAFDNGHLQVRNGGNSRPSSRLCVTPTNTASTAIQLNSNGNLLTVNHHLGRQRRSSDIICDIQKRYGFDRKFCDFTSF